MKKSIICMIMLAFILIVSGCTLVTKNTPEQSASTQQDTESTGLASPSPDHSSVSNSKKITMKLYFPNGDNSALLSEEQEVDVMDGAVMRAAIDALLKGPSRSDLHKVIPEGTKILGVTRKDDVATIDFSKDFSSAAGVAEILTRASVVNTLTEISGIQKVKILIEGEDLIGPSGLPLGAMERFALDKDGKPIPGESVTLTLYFGNANADYLIPEKREVAVNSGKPLEQVIFEELAKGPKTAELSPVIPQGTKLLSAKTENGLCTINLSAEFVDNNHSGSSGEAMTLYGIVNSLTEMAEVKKVQFLINGKVREAYIHAVLSDPFTRYEEIIKK